MLLTRPELDVVSIFVDQPDDPGDKLAMGRRVIQTPLSICHY
jgi:hypothetical protein